MGASNNLKPGQYAFNQNILWLHVALFHLLKSCDFYLLSFQLSGVKKKKKKINFLKILHCGLLQALFYLNIIQALTMPGSPSETLFYFKDNAGEKLTFESSGALPHQPAGTACRDSFLNHHF